MKKLLMALLCCSFLFVSCSKEKANEVINDAKIKVADKTGAAVEKELKEAFASVSIDGVNCADEAVKIGNVAAEKVKDLLKVQSFNKSLGGSIVPQVCNFVVSNVFPELVSKIDTEYVCLKQLGSDKLSKVATDLCNGLDL